MWTVRVSNSQFLMKAGVNQRSNALSNSLDNPLWYQGESMPFIFLASLLPLIFLWHPYGSLQILSVYNTVYTQWIQTRSKCIKHEQMHIHRYLQSYLQSIVVGNVVNHIFIFPIPYTIPIQFPHCTLWYQGESLFFFFLASLSPRFFL